MKRGKRILSLLLLLALLPMTVAAQSLEGDTTLTVYALYDKTPIQGMKWEAYQVATMDSSGQLTLCPAFSGCLDPIPGDDAAWQQLAQTVEQFVISGSVTPTRAVTTNEVGIAAFGTLEKGLYLLRANALEQGAYVYATAPFFLQLPQSGEDGWIHDVEAWGKLSKNERYVDITVTKNWKDDCVPAHSHPQVTVHLWRDGELWDTQTLPQKGKWSYTWADMAASHTWGITEEPVPGYTQQDPVEQEGYTFTITNVCDKTPTRPAKPGKLPQTGQLWRPVPVLLLAGLICLAVGLLRRRKEDQ